MDFRARYLEFLRSQLPAGITGRRVGIDCSNGMASLLVHEIFPEAVTINDVPDGTFPCHSPNPLLPDSRVQLSRLVRERELDCGIVFDGDADRAMFIDERGEFVQPDYLIPVIAASFPTKGKVLHDVRTSRGAIEAIRELGCEPVMVPVGHAFAKPQMRATGAICGGELAGHYYFSDFFGCDSAFLAAIRTLGEFRRRGSAFSEMMRPISSRYANSGELNFKVEDKDAAIDRILATARSFAPVCGRSDLDGVRVEFDAGWINVRKSNTEPYLRLIVEATTVELMHDWRRQLERAVAR